MSNPEIVFENAKVGDRCFSPLFKSVNADDKTNLTIVSIMLKDYPIEVKPDVVARYHTTTIFGFDGSWIEDGGQVLFWENPIKEIPVRPKRKVIKKGYIGISPSCANPGLIAITNTDIFSERNMMCSGDNNQIVPIEFEVEE